MRDTVIAAIIEVKNLGCKTLHVQAIKSMYALFSNSYARPERRVVGTNNKYSTDKPTVPVPPIRLCKIVRQYRGDGAATRSRKIHGDTMEKHRDQVRAFQSNRSQLLFTNSNEFSKSRSGASSTNRSNSTAQEFFDHSLDMIKKG